MHGNTFLSIVAMTTPVTARCGACGADLRPATWLTTGMAPTQAAGWAGQSAEDLRKNYAKCIAGQDEAAKRRISDALGGA